VMRSLSSIWMRESTLRGGWCRSTSSTTHYKVCMSFHLLVREPANTFCSPFQRREQACGREVSP